MSGPSGLSREQIEGLLVRPWWATPAQTVCSVGAYIALVVAGFMLDRLYVWIPIWAACGFILACALGAAHDCGHGTYATSRIVNRLAGAAWSSVILFNFTVYKYYHLEHHAKTGMDGDTEPRGKFPSIWAYIASLPTLSFFSAFWKMSLDIQRGQFPHFVRGERAKRDARIDNRILGGWVLSAILCTAMWPTIFLYGYWLPLLFYFPMVFFTSLPEHYGCEDTTDGQRNTRSVTSNAVFRFFFWNGNFHAEHHLLPRVPSWNLPDLHKLLRGSLVHSETSYLRFHARLIWHLIVGAQQPSNRILSPTRRVAFPDAHRQIRPADKEERT